ncbi:hypothetical protein ACFQ2O_02905 [Pontibacter rugosus]|uniref:Uncharacterized protein n=1 Tax=Pontibacter rugosus TaxID=1745966 RepID=A0ABW3SMG4_9BACT
MNLSYALLRLYFRFILHGSLLVCVCFRVKYSGMKYTLPYLILAGAV